MAVLVVGWACAPPGEPRGTAVAAASASEQDRASRAVIDHLSPARDSIGSVPSRFEWTPIEKADRYVIRVWSEVDQLLWRQDDVSGTSVARPDQLQLGAGTYLWSVSAVRDDQEIAESGLAAFIVRQ